MKRTVLHCSLAIMVIVAMPADSQAWGQVNWAPDFETARQAAAAQNKLLLIHFWQTACAPCKVVEERVFPKASVAQTIHESFVPLKVNARERPGLRLQFQVDRFPTDVIATPAGKVLHKMVTPQDSQAYVHQLTAIALANRSAPTRSNNSRWADGPQADMQLAGGPRPPGGGSRLGQDVSRYSEYGPGPMRSGQNISQNIHSPTTTSRFELPQSPATPAQQSGQATSNQPQSITNWHVAGATHGAMHAASEIANPFVASQPPPRQQVMPPRGAAVPSSAPGSMAPSGRAMVPQATTQPPLGLDGRCPVTLVRDRLWQRGDVRWGAIHRGRTYLFIGLEQQQAFLADPDRYSPVLAGMDVVRLATEGRIVEGSRRYGVIIDDDGEGPLPSRIYLFDSENSRNQFEQGPERFLRPVLQAMQQGTLDTLLR